jgi:asparagine synthase (glutamine-hydrolysing)
MCGIWSLLSKTALINTDVVKYFTEFIKIKNRGPDATEFKLLFQRVILGFHRLRINDLSVKGDQPFCVATDDRIVYAICNGEIYNFKHLIKKYNIPVTSNSDCEVIPHLYNLVGIAETVRLIKQDAEFAFTIIDYNVKTQSIKIVTARDPVGVRQLYFGYDKNGICFSSELKGVAKLFDNAQHFPPGCYLEYDIVNDDTFKITPYYEYVYPQITASEDVICDTIYEKFQSAVRKRLISDAPIACALSGGLDSSAVSAMAAKLLKNGDKLRTFVIGLEGGTDIAYANQVAKHIGSQHTVIHVTEQEALAVIDEVICATETYDCTTIRASVWQYLLGKYIAKNTDIKVVLTGEGSDEVTSGYLYFHKHPGAKEMHAENVRLVRDISMYDGLRADKSMANWGLEVRVAFLDTDFMDYYLSIDPKLRKPRENQEKYLLRKALSRDDLLPKDVLYRCKEAFSDGCSSHARSWYQMIQEYIDKIITDTEFNTAAHKYEHCAPDTKEKYYYRKRFEEFYGDKCVGVVPYYWMPKWVGEKVDPSARKLNIYDDIMKEN